MHQFTGIILESIAQIAGKYPEVPLSPGVDYMTLVAGDADPVFVTLPIGAVGTESRNGRKYDRAAVEAIVSAINSERSIGQKGHLRDEERAWRFDIPPLLWVGATLETDGKAWGKAYVLKSAPDVREYIRVAKASNAKIGTSIYGAADIDDEGNISNLQIESIDLAHPGRLGVPMTGAVPQITQEMDKTKEEAIVPEAITTAVATVAATVEPAEIAEMKREQQKTVRELQGKIAELEGSVKDLGEIKTMLGGNNDPINALGIMQRQLADMQKENLDLLAETIKAKVTEQVKIESARPLIIDLVQQRKPATRRAMEQAVTDVLGGESVKALLKSAVLETMGPAQQRPAQQTEVNGAEALIVIPKESV